MRFRGRRDYFDYVKISIILFSNKVRKSLRPRKFRQQLQITSEFSALIFVQK